MRRRLVLFAPNATVPLVVVVPETATAGDPVGAGNAFGGAVMPVLVRDGRVAGEAGRVEVDDVPMGWPLSVVVQAAWRYSLMSPAQVACRWIGWPGRYATTAVLSGARWRSDRWGRWAL